MTGSHLAATSGAADVTAPSTPAISIVIPTLGRREALRRTLTSLAGCAPPPGGFEVVLVFDGPAPEATRSLTAASVPLSIRFAGHAERRGRAAACNTGMRIAAGEIILILDDDVAVSRDLLVTHWRFHQRHADRACLGHTSPWPVDRPTLLSARASRRYAGLARRLVAEAGLRSPRDASTVNFSLPRTVALASGGFDERIRRYGDEDVEWVHRLIGRGVTISFVPEAVAHHWVDKSLVTWVAQRAEVAVNDLELSQRIPDLAPHLVLSAEMPRWSRRKRGAFWCITASPRVFARVVSALSTVADAMLVPGSSRGDRAVRLLGDLGYYSGSKEARRRFAGATSRSARSSRTGSR